MLAAWFAHSLAGWFSQTQITALDSQQACRAWPDPHDLMWPSQWQMGICLASFYRGGDKTGSCAEVPQFVRSRQNLKLGCLGTAISQ